MNDFEEVISQLLKSPKLSQPYTYSPEKTSYRQDLKKRLSIFEEKIDSLSINGAVSEFLKNNINEIKNINSLINSAVDKYLSGSAGKAYDYIEALFDNYLIQSHIRFLKKDMGDYSANGRPLFRVRTSERSIGNRKEMFHIPFELRHLVATQRYSIAGVPCLYLGSSLYVCWQEMGKPDLNTLYLSKYSISQNRNEEYLKILDFAYSLEHLVKTEFEKMITEEVPVEQNIAKIIFFPLQLACSYERAYQTGSFHPEYIIPNLVLQWINHEKRPVSGISYFSTKTKHLKNHDTGINFVFPPKTIEPRNRGYCRHLANSFTLSKPVSWQLLSTISLPQKTDEHLFPKTDNLEEALVKNYSKTEFFHAEKKLQLFMKLDSINC